MKYHIHFIYCKSRLSTVIKMSEDLAIKIMSVSKTEDEIVNEILQRVDNLQEAIRLAYRIGFKDGVWNEIKQSLSQ